MNHYQIIVSSTLLTQIYHLLKWNSSGLKNIVLRWWFGLLSLRRVFLNRSSPSNINQSMKKRISSTASKDVWCRLLTRYAPIPKLASKFWCWSIGTGVVLSSSQYWYWLFWYRGFVIDPVLVLIVLVLVLFGIGIGLEVLVRSVLLGNNRSRARSRMLPHNYPS